MNLTWLAPIGSLLALGFALFFTSSILKKSEGTDRMKEIAHIQPSENVQVHADNMKNFF